MAQEQIYEQQTGPRAAAPLPLPDAQQYGAGVGQAAMQAGQQVHQQELRSFENEKKIAADQQSADWAHRFAVKRAEMDDAALDLQGKAGPGGAGYTDAVGQAYGSDREAMFDGIDDPGVRRQAEAQYDAYGSGLHGTSSDWEHGQRVAKVVTDRSAAIDIGSNRVRRGLDPAAYAQELAAQLAANAQLNNLDPTGRDKLDKYTTQSFGVAFVQHLQDTNPAMAKAVLDSGQFDFLEPAQLEQLRNGTDVEIRRKEAEAEHVRAVAVSQGKDQIEALKTDYGNGVEIPDATFASAIQLATQMGDASLVADLTDKRASNQFAHVYSGQTPRQIEQRVAVLAGKAKRSQMEDRELTWLTGPGKKKAEQFNSDPVSWATENAPAGTKPPPGDIFSDPAAMRARAQWAKVNGPAMGRELSPFTKGEVNDLTARKASGPGGEYEVLGILDTIPDEAMRLRAAKQIDGSDAVFVHMSVLNPRARATIRNGADALRANPAMLTPDKQHPQIKGWMQIQDREVRQALKAMPATDVDATLLIGKQFAAGYQSGRAIDANHSNPGTFGSGYRVALGGATRPDGQVTGGIMHWGSGVYAAPPGLTHNEFHRAVQQDILARNAVPINPDGSTAMLGGAVPVWIGTDPQDPEVYLYRWETSGGRVLQGIDKQGKPTGDFVSRVRDK